LADPIFLARGGGVDISLLPALANRHGLVTGATGTGKTVTLQRLAEGFSHAGVPVFVADVKGDLAGVAASGSLTPKVQARLELLRLAEPQWQGCPAIFWEVGGGRGHPVRTTISDLGPQLLSRTLGLNATQAGVLTIAFELADDNGLLLLDLKDLRALLELVGEKAKELTRAYGNVSAASLGAILRALLQLEQEGGEQLFGEPMLDVGDLMRTAPNGQGVVSVLCADVLVQRPRVYSTFLLWLLAELFERLPEVGDADKPKLVFFFDEAHLLFADAPKELLAKVEQLVRLIRSKGVGVYFVTQSPLDVPESVLGQLGNRVQHALRGYTPKDQQALRAVAQGMRPSPGLDIQQTLQELGVGEALISLLDAQGTPSVTVRAFVAPPLSRIGPLSEPERAAVRSGSPVARAYDTPVDRVSAYEVLRQRAERDSDSDSTEAESPRRSTPPAARAEKSVVGELLFGSVGPRGGRKPGLVDALVRSAGTTLGRELTRGVLGSLLGGAASRKRR
jgi:uncharacterized protein